MRGGCDKAWIDLRRLRTEREWSQEETARRLGVTRMYLSAIENGRRGISLRMMAAIIRVFDVTYEDFYGSAPGAAGMGTAVGTAGKDA